METKDPIVFPEHHSLYITHNEHRTNYQSINDYLNEPYVKDSILFEDAQECLRTDSIWEVQVYPRTPISFYKTVDATFGRAVELMLQNYKDGIWT